MKLRHCFIKQNGKDQDSENSATQALPRAVMDPPGLGGEGNHSFPLKRQHFSNFPKKLVNFEL